MEQGQFQERLFSMIRNTGIPIPDSVKNKPRLLPGLAFYWIAFLTLSSERTNGFGVGRIPWSRAMQYLDRHGRFTGHDQDYFWTVLAGVDSAFVKYHNDKQKDASSSGGGSSNPPKGKPPPRARRRR